MARALVLSTAALITSAVAPSVAAHELQPAVANLTVSDATVSGTIELSVEPLIAGMDLSEIEDTDASDKKSQYEALRALPPAELTEAFNQAWPQIASKIWAQAGDTALDLMITGVEIPEVGDIEVSRLSKLMISAALPADDSAVTFGFAADLGGLIVRQAQADGTVGYAALLGKGDSSAPMPRDGSAEVGGISNFLNYIKIGFEHIIPKGLDHILFVLGLFFFSLKMRPLITQVTAFTLAHTVTLALATLGIVSVPASIVEPLIALSIVFVAVENIRGGELNTRRILVVLAFGLLHGLGFASVLGDVGLEPSNFIASLIGFNIGVEIGQLAVIAVAFILLGLPFGKRDWYRKGIAIPASVLIAAVGAYWTIERVFF